ncbi:MAG: hypothetical protein AVDCRST_MAG64-3310, partial [uncultured Phycisphaerae bacterium]
MSDGAIDRRTFLRQGTVAITAGAVAGAAGAAARA